MTGSVLPDDYTVLPLWPAGHVPGHLPGFRSLSQEGNTMTTDSPLVRQWILIKSLSSRSHGMTLQEIADELCVSSRTVRRDLSTLEEAGFPVAEELGEYGRKTWRLSQRLGKADLGFTVDEALALYLGRKRLLPFVGTVIWEAMERAFRKIRGSLDHRALRYLDRAGEAFQETHFGDVDYSRHGDIIDSLQLAIEDHRVAFITYRSDRATEPVTYDIYPLRFVRHRGALYLLGYKPSESRYKTWRVDRIEQSDVEQMPFTFPPADEIDARLHDAFGIYDGNDLVRVRIRFSPRVARYVSERIWHSSQQLTTLRTGGVLGEFRVSGTSEIKSWVLSFGRHAEVLEPASLRQEIAAELSAVLTTYFQSKLPPS